MPKKIKSPKIIQPAGNKPKIIKEYIGLINSDTNDISIAHMHSPQGWEEPGQKPELDEYYLKESGFYFFLKKTIENADHMPIRIFMIK